MTVCVHIGFGCGTGTDVFQERRVYVWDDRFDTATLRNDRDRFVVEVPWGYDRDPRRRPASPW
ncbi:hypothetical protein [Streptomyces sp. NPDC017673]|uniref:hypothetical protein n=1 Tax=unclassified Streptomyces TaxID=2593676 RepID=UPI00379EB6D4